MFSGFYLKAHVYSFLFSVLLLVVVLTVANGRRPILVALTKHIVVVDTSCLSFSFTTGIQGKYHGRPPRVAGELFGMTVSLEVEVTNQTASKISFPRAPDARRSEGRVAPQTVFSVQFVLWMWSAHRGLERSVVCNGSGHTQGGAMQG